MLSRQAICGYVSAFLLVSGCSRPPAADALPAIPKLDLTTYRAQVRGPVEKAYQAAQAKPTDADANGNLGMLMHAFEQLESAQICYRRARAFDPQKFQWAYYLGLVQALNGKNQEAAANLRDAIRIDPGYVPARIKLAEVLLNLGRFDESREVSQSILKDNPQVAPAYYWVGRVNVAQGRSPQAIEAYKKACELWPAYGTAHYALALLYQKAGEQSDAERHMAAYQKYKADSDPQPEDPMLEAVRSLDNSALAHLMKGVDLENAGRLEQAIGEEEEAVRQDPKLAQAYANLIGLYGRTGQAAEVEKAYRATVAINPNLPQSHYDYGVFLSTQQKYAEAERAFRKALESSPNYAEAHSNLGAMLERRGDLRGAEKQYQLAIENKPNFRQAQYQMGHLLLMEHKPAEAIAHLSQTLTPEDQDTPRFMLGLGVAYAEAGDFSSAHRYLDQAAQRATALGQDPLAGQIRGLLAKVDERAAK
jgi:tetratricopeptide (TPR) repeat protein